MSEQRCKSEVCGRGAPADTLVGILYGLPTLEVSGGLPTRPASTIATVGEALDVERKIASDLVAPVHRPDGLKRDAELVGYREAGRPVGVRDGFVLPGRPFPRFPLGRWGR